ncbi:hypothetical protein KTR66_18675 [Roseococcus sp. SDR]|uniref:hypothetical protein n=1 Tax=Roseococcus sp. SDR TaxID=2835532 RepID=UPI001BCFDB09|nr:hypothetical protein [Roseococcus sp. SDR]MBS7792032.1 hypothetical protein [Roseococcus sp. SDR]MBV1847346.1 hypothetical protein [Roseococcus sp. SDR]
MLRLLPLLIVLILPATAQAQLARFCNGRVTAERTDTDRSSTTITYYAFIRSQAPANITLTYRGNLLDRPMNRSFQVSPSGLRVKLGHQANGVGQTLISTQLVEAIAITC